ncbi:hypothetical protein LINPERHAP1_LOCUS12863 [Linum perenne]
MCLRLNRNTSPLLNVNLSFQQKFLTIFSQSLTTADCPRLPPTAPDCRRLPPTAPDCRRPPPCVRRSRRRRHSSQSEFKNHVLVLWFRFTVLNH